MEGGRGRRSRLVYSFEDMTAFDLGDVLVPDGRIDDVIVLHNLHFPHLQCYPSHVNVREAGATEGKGEKD